MAIHFAIATITGSSVNPARSIGSALVGGDLNQLWIYLVGPTVGGIIGWAVYAATDNPRRSGATSLEVVEERRLEVLEAEPAGVAHLGPDPGLGDGEHLADVVPVVVDPFAEELVDAQRSDRRVDPDA